MGPYITTLFELETTFLGTLLIIDIVVGCYKGYRYCNGHDGPHNGDNKRHDGRYDYNQVA